MNLTQMLVTHENVDQISRKFGLTEEQALDAMAAVIPAFSEGLKRQTETPQGTAGLIQALASGRHAQYALDPSSAVNAFGLKDGNAILGHLFETKDVSRAVAGHAAASTGLGSSLIKNLLPAIASMVMGSLFKSHNSGSGTSGGGLLGQIIESLAGGMMDGAGQATPKRRARGRGRGRRSNQRKPGSLEDLLGQVLGGGQNPKRQRTSLPRSRTGHNTRRQNRADNRNGGLGGILDELLGGGQSSQRTRRGQNQYVPQPKARQNRQQRRQNRGLDNIFGDTLEPGGNTSTDYQRQTGSVFDEFLGG